MLAYLTAVNAIKGYLQALPQDATVDVIIHVADKADIIELEQIEAHSQHSVEWLVTDEPETDLLDQVTRLCAGYNAQPMVFMALEDNLLKAIRRVVASSF